MFKHVLIAIGLMISSVSSLAHANDNILIRVYAYGPEKEPYSGRITLDPAAHGGLTHWQNVLSDIFMPLLGLSTKNGVVPGAASSWGYSPDGMSIHFELDPEGRWSDGEPVTAEDFVFAMQRAANKDFAPAAPKYVTSNIRGFDPQSGEPFGVVAEAPNRLRIDLTSPYAISKYTLTRVAFSPLPRHASPKETVIWSEWETPVSNGPYILDKIDGEKIRLRQNPYQLRSQSPAFEYVVHKSMEWSESAHDFLKGDIDFLYGIPMRQAGWFRKHDLPIYSRNASIYYYAMNAHLPELEDKRVRRALRLAVDRKDLVKRLLPGFGKPAFSIIPESIEGYTPDESLRIHDFEAAFAEAEKLMREAGYGPDNRLKLTISSNDQSTHKEIAALVKAGWSRIYVDAEIDMEEKAFRKWFKRFTDGEYVIGRRSWSSETPFMNSFMNVCKALNDARCGHIDLVEYKEALDKAYDPYSAKRLELFREADRLLIDADVVIPLYHGVTPVVLGERIDATRFEGKFSLFRSAEFQLREKTMAAE